jgi:adenylate cyclase
VPLLRSTWFIPAAMLALALLLRYFDPPAIETLRLSVFDEFQRLAPAEYEDAGVRVVDLDDDTLERLGQWPWPRIQVANLVERLASLGVAAIAFDAVFSEPDRTTPQRMVRSWFDATTPSELVEELSRRLPDHDTVFAKAIANAPTVLGFPLTPEPTVQRPIVKWSLAMAGDDPRPFLAPFRGAIVNLPQLAESAKGAGSFSIVPERDGVIRRVPLMYALNERDGTGQIIPSLAAEALRVAQIEPPQNGPTYIIKASNANNQGAFGEHTGVNHIRIGKVIVPTDANGRIWLRDTGRVGARTIPAWTVMQGEASAEDLSGTIVFIGTSAQGLKDLRVTPLDAALPGVDVHARLAEQMILGDYLLRPDWMDGAEWVYLLVSGIALLLLLPRWGPMPCAVVATLAIGAAFAGSWFGYTQQHMLIDPFYPSIAVLAVYLASSLLVFLRTESERKRVRTAFSQYMAPAMVERLARDPSQLKLGGETRDMTVLFSDIRDFTSISETMDAAALIRFLNRFLTPMTNIITGRSGTIDKYMGDAIMAFWNAPLDDPDHAPNAARASLEMLKELDRLNSTMAEEAKAADQPFRPLAIGIGLNTGPLSVGNMGSDLHMNYSVVGDDVNLASRLEGQSKTYGVPIVIGENTRARLGDGFAILELDLLRVKGKQRPVRVFGLLGDEKVGGEVWFRAISEAQGAMLKSYRAGDWPRAAALLGLCKRASEGRFQALWKLYEDRIEEMRSQALPADWDGVAVARTK